MRKLKTHELGRLSVSEFKEADKFPLIFIMENVRSALNIGSVFRTADAFRLEAIYLVGFSPCPPNRDMYKTAIGATETVRWQHFDSCGILIPDLKSKGYKVYAAEQVEQSIKLDQFKVSKNEPLALVFGNEITGVSQECINLCDGVLEIPQFGMKHSLNVAVSAGVMGWHVVNQWI